MSTITRGKIFAGLALSFSISFNGYAAMTKDALLYQGLALEARDKSFAARNERDLAKLKKERARFVLDLQKGLSPSGATSAFEYSNAVIALMKATFEEGRGESAAKDAETSEKIWQLRREWELGNSAESLGAIASHYVTLREERLNVLKDLSRSAVDTNREIAFQHERSRLLLNRQTISRDDFNVIDLAYAETKGLVKVAAEEIKLAEVQVVEAKGNLNISRATDVVNRAQAALALLRTNNAPAGDVEAAGRALEQAQKDLVTANREAKEALEEAQKKLRP